MIGVHQLPRDSANPRYAVLISGQPGALIAPVGSTAPEWCAGSPACRAQGPDQATGAVEPGRDGRSSCLDESLPGSGSLHRLCRGIEAENEGQFVDHLGPAGRGGGLVPVSAHDVAKPSPRIVRGKHAEGRL